MASCVCVFQDADDTCKRRGGEGERGRGGAEGERGKEQEGRGVGERGGRMAYISR